jgi:RsiW-degrading membrane proteinase PrsW (M82 family)
MVLAILLSGVVIGVAVDAFVPAWIKVGANDRDREQPEPEPMAPDFDRLEQFAAQGEWRALWGAIPGTILSSWRELGATTLALLTGGCWLAFSIQSIQPRSARDGRLWATWIAVALGVLSVWPTVFLIYYQEYRWGLEEGEALPQSVRFFVLGVGLREELAKFVCFLPLLPWCVRRRDELAALVLAGCVGIGFAMEENVNYIRGSVGTATLTRLLMPAPLHMAMTGLIGLAAYRACVWPREWGLPFVATFGVVVLAHGLYDVLVGLPAWSGLDYFGLLIFIVLVRQYFRELRAKQALRVEPVSLTANFLCCVSLVAAATFVYLSAAAGWKIAGDALVMGAVAQAVMAYLFLREMPETMVTV